MKIHPVGAELFHVAGRTDRKTDMTKLIVTFCNSGNTPKRRLTMFKNSSDKMVIPLKKGNDKKNGRYFFMTALHILEVVEHI
jgi:hypothetical protein